MIWFNLLQCKFEKKAGPSFSCRSKIARPVKAFFRSEEAPYTPPGFMKFLPVFLGIKYYTKLITSKWRFDIYAFSPAKMLCTFETYKVKWDL